MKKYISLVLLILILIFMFSTIVLADGITASMSGYQTSGGNGFFNRVGSNIYGIILIIGGAVALGGLAIMGAKFMTAAPGEKAEIKKNLVGFTVGVIILVCAVSLLTIFSKVGQEIEAVAVKELNNKMIENIYLV